jgi:diguanylate cyclase (GGDEF)-like protein
LEFSSASGREVEMIDDRIQQGESVAKLTRRPDALVMDCDISPAYQWPYCTYYFPLSLDSSGVDLSAFDSISIDMSYVGPGQHDVRMSLRNFEPGMSKPGDDLSQKIIEVQFRVPAQGIVQFPVKVLRTAPWWIDMRQVPIERTDMRIDRVTSVALSIGTEGNLGHRRLELRSLKFHGKLISQNHLLLILVCVWLLAALAWLTYALLQYRVELRVSTTRLALLSQINDALQLEASELADQAYTDSLTGAMNREGLRDALMYRWRQPGRSQEMMAVVFVDLDHFKQINDTLGHAVGDEVLRAFVASIQSEIRTSDKLVRWGGDEFLIVCQGTGAPEAQALANKLRDKMVRQIWPRGVRLAASFGVTALHYGEDIGEAIKRADSALYQAKSSGRNCVQIA